MRIAFELTRDDYAALTFARAPSQTVSRRRMLLLVVLLGVVLCLMALLTSVTGSFAWVDQAPFFRPLLYATGGTLVAFFTLTGFLWALRVWVRRLPREDGAILGKHEIELAEEGFHVEGRAGRSFVKWSAVVEVRETREHTFLFVDRMMAYIVPKRAFSSEAEYASFVAFTRETTRARSARPC